MAARRARPEWVPRAVPRAPVAVVALDGCRGALLSALLHLDEERFGRLRGVVGARAVAVLGAEDDLPWFDGALWLGRDEEAPSLLLPTTLDPAVPVALLARAVDEERGRRPLPVALLPSARALLSLGRAQPLDVEAVKGHLEAMT